MEVLEMICLIAGVEALVVLMGTSAYLRYILTSYLRVQWPKLEIKMTRLEQSQPRQPGAACANLHLLRITACTDTEFRALFSAFCDHVMSCAPVVVGTAKSNTVMPCGMPAELSTNSVIGRMILREIAWVNPAAIVHYIHHTYEKLSGPPHATARAYYGARWLHHALGQDDPLHPWTRDVSREAGVALRALAKRLGCTIVTLRHVVPVIVATKQRARAVGEEYMLALLHRMPKWVNDGVPIESNGTFHRKYTNAVVQGYAWASSSAFNDATTVSPSGGEEAAPHAALRTFVDTRLWPTVRRHFRKTAGLGRSGGLVLGCLIDALWTHKLISLTEFTVWSGMLEDACARGVEAAPISD